MTRYCSIAIIFGIILCLFSGCSPERSSPPEAVPKDPQQRLPSLIEQAQEQYDEEKYHEAFVTYNRAREADPRNFEIEYGLARTNAKLHDDVDALDAVERALEIKPNSYRALELEGRLLLRSRRYEAAIESLNKAVQMKPDYTVAWLNLCSAYQLNKQYKKATDAAKRAQQTDPDAAGPHFALGEVYLAQENLDDAVAEYKKAVSKDDQHALAYLRLADIYISQNKDLDQARKWAVKSNEIDGADGTAAMAAAHVLYVRDEKAKAVKELAQAAEDHPQNHRIWARMASILKELGRDEAAERALNNARRFMPKPPDQQGDSAGSQPPEDDGAQIPAQEGGT